MQFLLKSFINSFFYLMNKCQITKEIIKIRYYLTSFILLIYFWIILIKCSTIAILSLCKIWKINSFKIWKINNLTLKVDKRNCTVKQLVTNSILPICHGSKCLLLAINLFKLSFSHYLIALFILNFLVEMYRDKINGKKWLQL